MLKFNCLKSTLPAVVNTVTLPVIWR